MTLVIPLEIKRDINKFSGFISTNSKFANKNLKGLFRTNENMKYLSHELYQLLTNEQYIRNNLPDNSIEDIHAISTNEDHDYRITGYGNDSYYSDKSKQLVKWFLKQKPNVDRNIFAMVEAHQLPFQEDLDTLNPIQQLHHVNLDFLVKSSRNIIQTPQNLVIGVNHINPDTNNIEYAEYDYDPSSYSDGTWHPEHLFTNCSRNRENPYWLPLEVNIYSDADAKGVGHKYNDIIYNQGTRDYYASNIAYDGSAKNPKVNTKQKTPSLWKSDDTNNSYGQFPMWQTSVNKRYYDKDNTSGLRDQGENDRRVQIPHGYNMKKLIKKPSV